MRERPIQDLIDGLVALGVEARCTLGSGCPPVEINATGLQPGKARSQLLPCIANSSDKHPCYPMQDLGFRA